LRILFFRPIQRWTLGTRWRRNLLRFGTPKDHE